MKINFISDGQCFNNKEANFIYGLAANPFHVGHLDVIKELLKIKGSMIHIVISKNHAYGKKLADYNLRKKVLLSLLNRNLNEDDLDRLIVDDVEEKISKDGVIYSVDLKHYYEKNFPNKNYVWVFGEDNCNDENLKKFKDHEELIQWEILKIKETIPLHSTLIRKWIEDKDIFHLKEIYNDEEIVLLVKMYDTL